MAVRKILRLVDDLDGSDAAESVYFILNGTCYQVDLSEENFQRVRDHLKTYLQAAREVDYPVRTEEVPAARAIAGAEGAPTSRDIRRWAREAGVVVCERGAIPKALIAAYHNDGQATPRG
jgi:hypothetical protein